MASTLTEEQKRRIEESRKLALERRAARLAEVERIKKANVGISYPNSIQRQQNSSSGLAVSAKSFYSKCQESPKKVLSSTNLIRGNSLCETSTKNFKDLNANGTALKIVPKLPPGNVADSSAHKSWNVTTDALLGTVSLISRDRFVVEVGYNAKLIELCKTIPGRIYDVNKKAWTFPLKEYERFKKLTAPLAPQIVIGNLPANILKVFLNNWEASIDYKTIDLSRIEPTLINHLYPFQKEGVQFGVSKSGRCMIADDMGLGKTIQALGIADYYKEEWPLLIVCPSSMRYQWEEEIRRNLPKVPSYSIYVINNNKDVIERAKVVILSYDLMATKKDFLKSYGFGVIIIDECHSLKSLKTKRTRAALELVSKIRRIILLSGTPALSRPAELFTQIKALQPNLFKDMIEFGIRYCEGKQDKFGWNFNGSCNLEELKVILEEKIMIRRLKSDVLAQLPSKTRQVIVIESNMSNKKSMSAFAKKLSDEKINGTDKRSTLLAYFAETGLSKINSIKNYIEELLLQNKKFLVFAHHKSVLDAICETLEKNETYYIRIDGSVSSEERKNVSDQFQEEADYKVAVLSLKAANTGITLTAARLVVFAELFWNPGELIQAEDRAHRIGQESNVIIQYLIAKGTADDYLWPLIQGKINVLNKAGLTNATSLEVNETLHSVEKNKKQQPTITDYFSSLDDDGLDEADLVNLLDEIEGVQEKKMKFS